VVIEADSAENVFVAGSNSSALDRKFGDPPGSGDPSPPAISTFPSGNRAATADTRAVVVEPTPEPEKPPEDADAAELHTPSTHPPPATAANRRRARRLR
jgi:hypothetical protein